MPIDARAQLLRACALAERAQRGQARAALDDALPALRGDGALELAAALVAFTTFDHQRALALLYDAATRSPALARRARSLGVRFASELGWNHEALELLDAAIDAEPQRAELHVMRMRAYGQARWDERALVSAQHALALQPGHAALWMEAASLHASLDQRAEAQHAIERALQLAPAAARHAYLQESARVSVDAGDLAGARGHLRRLLAETERAETKHATNAPSAAAHAATEPAATDGAEEHRVKTRRADVFAELAELASWADDLEGVDELTRRALDAVPEHGVALRVLGGVALRAGDLERADALLGRAEVAAPRDPVTQLWRAELSMRARRYAESHARLESAQQELARNGPAGAFWVVAWLLRFLVDAYESAGRDQPVGAHRTEELDDALRELVPELAARADETRTLGDFVAAAEGALAALRGNRSVTPTHLVDGALVRLQTRSGCRHASRWALQLLRVAEPRDCLAKLDAVAERYPRAALPICHRGELHLWLGNLADARRDLEAAIARVPGTRWAYMGLSTLDLLAGDGEAALASNARGVHVMRGSEGPALDAFRGEALRKLGRLDEAIAVLERAVARHPTRVSAALNLALAYEASERRDALGALWTRLLYAQAAGLLTDAAAELELTVIGDGDWAPARDVMRAVLERALQMMRGNRSASLVTYFTGRGAPRFVPRSADVTRGPHARDAELLTSARQLLGAR